MTSRDELHHWLALLHLPGIGPVRLRELLVQHGSPSALFDHGTRDPALEPELRAALRAPAWEAVEQDLAWAGGERHIITLQDPRYPPLLAQLRDAPPLLFVHGAAEALLTPQLAMVGSRNPTPLGEETATQFARVLAAAGLTITSGLALGIDGASHRGALAAKGQTIAVFGTGPDRIYPARHRDLAHAIVDGGGALVSEYPPGTPPLPGHFPRRNRLISGLALGTLVVEAALRSGSLLTARSASEQGREVFAIPGSIHNPLARGCHRLIRDGAKLVETAQDILEELAPQLRAALAQEATPEVSEFNLDEDYRRLLDCIDFAPTAVDILVERSGLTADAVSSMLLLLELEGFVASAAGGGYARTSKESL
ncbi:DNA-processing protein DprA [Sulfurivermis fontis]|uniref:DNA-processing protein DprA n=1 Tax=Sulfurivermis fontis TaxID=1972068 RepID=UPI000FD727E0|nr:DNA-processing protein DprA [Sulfurivermis fontis]